MEGTCECGCGQATTIATKTDRSKNWIRGRPLRFALGHNARVTNSPRRVLSPSDYEVIDRGFTTPCWIWRGQPTGKQGYCRVGIGGRYVAAHRAYYEAFIGPIPERHDVHHACEQASCVRPDHLAAVPSTEHRVRHKWKITPDQVRAIRMDHRPLRQIAAEYGINYTYASCVRSGSYRRDVV